MEDLGEARLVELDLEGQATSGAGHIDGHAVSVKVTLTVPLNVDREPLLHRVERGATDTLLMQGPKRVTEANEFLGAKLRLELATEPTYGEGDRPVERRPRLRASGT